MGSFRCLRTYNSFASTFEVKNLAIIGHNERRP
jgi:hypothetical protein